MKASVSERLVNINRAFYQSFAGEFDATRRRLQPGVVQLLDRLAQADRLLDLGCGNGTLWNALAGRGFRGAYTGLDFSPELVRLAEERFPQGGQAQFLVRDLTSDWDTGLAGPFDAVAAFAVFHHLPPPHPEMVLNRCREQMAPKALLMLSCWQFLHSPRWQARIQPWEAVNLPADQVGPDDYLLDWRRGGTGLRYVHHFSNAELYRLAAAAGFAVLETFTSDGAEGKLGLYQVWQKEADW